MNTRRSHASTSRRLAGADSLALVLAASLLMLPAAAATAPRVAAQIQFVEHIVVNTTGDGDNVDVNGGCDADAATPGQQCTLRAAIQRANGPAGSGDPIVDARITFEFPAADPNCDAATGRCAINLAKPLPDITDSVEIEGPGADKLTVRRQGGSLNHVFHVPGAFTVFISRLTVSGGAPGINNVGTMSVTDCVISNNSAGGIRNVGTMTVTRSTISDNIGINQGGGVINFATLNVIDSTLSGNEVVSVSAPSLGFFTNGGGGIYSNLGTLNVTNSTLFGNTARGGPGFPDGVGGGILAGGGTVNINNSTLSGNAAVGSVMVSSSRGLGGGVAAITAVNVKNTIIANNTTSTFGPDVANTFNSQGYNLIENTADATITPAQPTDIFGVDPMLDPAGLQDNGGPTQTIALLAGSPATDKGTASGLTGALTTDQRGAGFPRAFDDPFIAPAAGGDNTDIGAFERQSAAPTPTPTPSPSPTPTPTPSPTFTISGLVADADTGAGLAGVSVTLSGAQSASTQTSASGEYSFTGIQAGGDVTVTPSKSGFSFIPPSQSFANLSFNAFVNFIGRAAPTATPTPTPPPTVPTFRFESAAYSVEEGVTAVAVRVLRTGPTGTAAAVEVTSEDGTAKQKGDYTFVVGRLAFAPGETEKSFEVLINEDGYAEGFEFATLILQHPLGGTLGAQSTATLQINDDPTEPTTNPVDDSRTFVGTHYHDFLYRQSDQTGEDFWTQNIESCGASAGCLTGRRADVSAAFFLSIEFQQTGYLVIRAHKAAFGNEKFTPRYQVFLGDQRQLAEGLVVGRPGWEQQLAANRRKYLEEFTTRPEFVAQFPQGQPAADFVDKLFANAGVQPSAAERAAAVSAYGTGDAQGRAAALGSVVESAPVYNTLYNPAFVLMQYFGYLRRNPDDQPDLNFDGYDFWLGKLDSFTPPGEDARDEAVALARVRRAEMVRAFIESAEYRKRFFGAEGGNQLGPAVSPVTEP